MGPDEISVVMNDPAHSVDLFVFLIKTLDAEVLLLNYTCRTYLMT
jgi:hypothetical protein